MIIEPVDVVRHGRTAERRTALTWGDDERFILSLDGPAHVIDRSDEASAEVAIALPFAMRHAAELEVRSLVDRALADDLDEIQAIYRAWDLLASPVDVALAAGLTPVARRSRRGRSAHRGPRRAAYFSRGVDSVYTAARPRPEGAELDALVFVDGLEPKHDEVVRTEEIRLAGEAAGRLGLPLAVVRTNVRELFDPAGFDWEDAVGAALAGIGLALAGGFDEVVIPSSDSYETTEPCGTSPLLDPLFTTSRVRIVHDSLARTRLGKVGWLVANRPDLLGDLKVCFKENRPDNCGTCGKCLLTMVCLHLHGALDQATAFPSTIDPDAIRAFRLPTLKARVDWAEVAGVLGSSPTDVALRGAALDALRTSVLDGPNQHDRAGHPVWSGPWWLRNNRLNATLSLVVDGEPYPPHPAPEPG